MKERRRHNSIGFRLHWWRGFACDCDLFMARVTLGFATLFADDVDLAFRMKALKGQLEKLAGVK